jgi:hypothetical protein
MLSNVFMGVAKKEQKALEGVIAGASQKMWRRSAFRFLIPV